MDKIVDIIFKPIVLTGTCCYPVWCLLVPVLSLVYLLLVIVNATIDGVVKFFREIKNELLVIKNPFRYELYEANRVSVRPKLKRDYFWRKKREKVKDVFSDIEED